MMRWSPFLGPWWLLAYAVSGVLWMAIVEVTPVPFVLTFAALGLLALYRLGSALMGGPPENR
jgi:hypothetical protein